MTAYGLKGFSRRRARMAVIDDHCGAPRCRQGGHPVRGRWRWRPGRPRTRFPRGRYGHAPVSALRPALGGGRARSGNSRFRDRYRPAARSSHGSSSRTAGSAARRKTRWRSPAAGHRERWRGCRARPAPGPEGRGQHFTLAGAQDGTGFDHMNPQRLAERRQHGGGA